MAQSNADPVIHAAGTEQTTLLPTALDYKDKSLQSIALMWMDHVGDSIRTKTQDTFKNLRIRQEHVRQLHEILKAVNMAKSADGSLDLSKSPALAKALAELYNDKTRPHGKKIGLKTEIGVATGAYSIWDYLPLNSGTKHVGELPAKTANSMREKVADLLSKADPKILSLVQKEASSEAQNEKPTEGLVKLLRQLRGERPIAGEGLTIRKDSSLEKITEKLKTLGVADELGLEEGRTYTKQETESLFTKTTELLEKAEKVAVLEKINNELGDEKPNYDIKPGSLLGDLLFEAGVRGLAEDLKIVMPMLYQAPEADRMVENLRMTADAFNVQNDLDMQEVGKLNNERHELYQVSRMIFKTIHEAITGMARSVSGR